MGVRILRAEPSYESTISCAVLYCSTSEWAFGPVFYDSEEHDAVDRAELFLEWLPKDAREYSDNELERKYCEWREQEKEQWALKEAVND